MLPFLQTFLEPHFGQDGFRGLVPAESSGDSDLQDLGLALPNMQSGDEAVDVSSAIPSHLLALKLERNLLSLENDR